MNSKNVVAALQIERAKQMSRIAGINSARSRFSNESVNARTKLRVIDNAISKIKAADGTVEGDKMIEQLSQTLKTQEQLMQELQSQINKGGRKDRHILSAYVSNMLMIRKTPMKVSEVREYFEKRGYILSNWPCFMRDLLKYNPSVVRVDRGVYMYKE